jgi:hypothetical protein
MIIFEYLSLTNVSIQQKRVSTDTARWTLDRSTSFVSFPFNVICFNGLYVILGNDSPIRATPRNAQFYYSVLRRTSTPSHYALESKEPCITNYELFASKRLPARCQKDQEK